MSTNTLAPEQSPEATTRRSRRLRWDGLSIIYPLGTLAVVVLLWQAATAIFSIEPYLLPAPSRIMSEIGSNWSMYLSHGKITTIEILVGFGISVALALPIAVLLAFSRFFSRTCYPLLVASQTVPKVALAPLFLVWLGFGWTPKIVIAVLIAFFPVVIDTVVGFKSVSADLHHLTRSMGASRLTMFYRVLLPHALPNIFSGMKIASTLVVIGAVVAEFVGADGGLGYIVMRGAADLNTTMQFAAIVLLTVLGIIFFGLISLIERWAIPWHVSVRGTNA